MVLMLVLFIVLLVLGMPIGFSLMLSSMSYLLSNNVPLTVIVQKFASGVNNFTLIAVPFFILAANFMNTAGITSRLFNFAKKCIGWIPGGLAHANVLASIIFAGMSGAAVADAGGLGLIEIQAMREDGYDDDFSAAVTGASSTIGPIIPPSIPMVVYCVLTGTSVAAMFAAGILPGLLMGFAMMVLIYFMAKKRKYPRHPVSTVKELTKATIEAIPTLLTPVIILGGILGGICTPTEAGAVAVLYSMFLGLFAYKSLNWKSIRSALIDTAYSTASVMTIVVGSTLFAWVLAIEQVPVMLGQVLMHMIGSSPFLFLLLTNVLFLILGCFLEPTAAMLIMMPMMIPICNQMGISLVHYGLVVVLNLMIGLLTPPVGLVLSMVSNLVNRPMEKIFKATIPFFLILVVVLLLITYIPSISLWIPTLLNYV
ncbi:MAG: TRAP transporter large permease [Sphaerochaetaceae bacterium]